VTDTGSEREYMTPAEVARAFSVDPKTVTRWANKGLITPHHRTLGGIRRYARAEVEALLKRDPR
jgi:excisionase family DNA binding protein